MAESKAFLVEKNQAQIHSETDDFTFERYRQMFTHFPLKSVDVLDVGCNTGRGGAVLKQLKSDLRLVGLDCIKERLACLDPHVYSKGICSFSSELPLDNNSFDVVVAGEFIEHVPPGEVGATLAEFFRVLKLKGRLLLTTPNPGYLKNKLRHLSVLLEDSHVTQHFQDCLRFRLRTVGFSNVRTYGSGRMTRYIGQSFPILNVYGSYLMRADKW